MAIRPYGIPVACRRGELPFAPFLDHASHAGKWEGFAKDAAIITMGEWQFALTFPYVLNFPYLCRRYAN